MTLSQSDQLLLRLMNGEWWTTRELLREVSCIVHSRISDLRAQGFLIEHRTTGKGAAGSEYRLLGDVTGGRPRKPGRRHDRPLESERVSGKPVSLVARSVSSGPMSGAGSPESPALPAAHLTAPAQGLQESLLAPGQLSLTEEAA